jgi:hypothetical protein
LVTGPLVQAGTDIVLVGLSTEIVVVDNANFDGIGPVDGKDFLIWQRGLGLTGQTTNANGDANHNGTVGAEDLGIWKTQFGTTPVVSAAGAVPEPASAALVLIAGAALVGRRRRR